MSITWTSLQVRFRDIVLKAEGPSKSSSGNITVEYNFDGELSVTLGTYDIGYWPRATSVGTFNSEEEALIATSKKLDEAEAVVSAELAGRCLTCDEIIDEEGECLCSDPYTDREEQNADYYASLDDQEVTTGCAGYVQRILNSNSCHCPVSQKCTCGNRFGYGLE